MTSRMWLNRAPWLLLGVGVLFPVPASGLSRPDTPTRKLAEARLLAVADGDLQEAITRLQVLLPIASGSILAEAAADLGDHYAVLGQEAAARAAYRTALDARADHVRAAVGWMRTGGTRELVPDSPDSPAGPLATRPGQGWEALLPEDERAGFRNQVDRFARQEASKRLTAAARRLIRAGQAGRATAIQMSLVLEFGDTLPLATQAELVLEIGPKARPDEGLQAFRTLEARAPGLRALAAPLRGRLWLQQGQNLWETGRLDAAIQVTQAALGDASIQAAQGRESLEALGRSLSSGLPAEAWRRASQRLNQLEKAAIGPDREASIAALRELAREHPRSNLDGRALVAAARLTEDGEALAEQVLADDRRMDLWPDGTRAGGRALALLARRREARGDTAGARQAWQQLLDQFPNGRDADGTMLRTLARERLGLRGDGP
ncbi:MAG: hypothetical protein VKO64_10290 [Candidatus Sericytochromatia bacterium]|nr:hypothetical protein [Candidatus Sericytochromatia bacterium]